MSLNDLLGGLFNRVAAGAGLLLLLAGPGTFANGQIETIGPITPGPVKLELRLGGGRSQFHLGEIIPVELTFSSPERRTYPIGEDCRPNQSYQYHVPPEFVDRAVELDAALMLDLGGNCHGGHGEVDPGEKPLVLKQVQQARIANLLGLRHAPLHPQSWPPRYPRRPPKPERFHSRLSFTSATVLAWRSRKIFG